MITFNNDFWHRNGNDEEGNNEEHIVTQSVKSHYCLSFGHTRQHAHHHNTLP